MRDRSDILLTDSGPAPAQGGPSTEVPRIEGNTFWGRRWFVVDVNRQPVSLLRNVFVLPRGGSIYVHFMHVGPNVTVERNVFASPESFGMLTRRDIRDRAPEISQNSDQPGLFARNVTAGSVFLTYRKAAKHGKKGKKEGARVEWVAAWQGNLFEDAKWLPFDGVVEKSSQGAAEKLSKSLNMSGKPVFVAPNFERPDLGDWRLVAGSPGTKGREALCGVGDHAVTKAPPTK
jgi:hypothetical protein